MANILVCTRREDLVKELVPLLRREHHVEIVPHLAGAVRSLLLTRFAAVVLDLDGESPEDLETLPIVGQLNPHLRTVVVSGPLSLEAEAGIRATGISRLLVRPLAPGELERHLAAVLRWPAAEPALLWSPSDASPS